MNTKFTYHTQSAWDLLVLYSYLFCGLFTTRRRGTSLNIQSGTYYILFSHTCLHRWANQLVLAIFVLSAGGLSSAPQHMILQYQQFRANERSCAAFCVCAASNNRLINVARRWTSWRHALRSQYSCPNNMRLHIFTITEDNRSQIDNRDT